MHRDEDQWLEVRHGREEGRLKRRDQRKRRRKLRLLSISLLDPDVGCMPARRGGKATVVLWELVMGLKGCRTSTIKGMKPSPHKSLEGQGLADQR
jgi:hypothetical protein